MKVHGLHNEFLEQVVHCTFNYVYFFGRKQTVNLLEFSRMAVFFFLVKLCNHIEHPDLITSN